MFEKAIRMKVRFPSPQGNLSLEDLWDLSLPKLNTMAKGLNKERKVEEEEDFLEVKSAADAKVALKFNIVLHIIKVKLDEEKARENKKEVKAKNEFIMEVIEEKEKDALKSMSVEDLKKQLIGG